MRLILFILLAFGLGYFNLDVGGFVRGIYYYFFPVALGLTFLLVFLAKKFFSGTDLGFRFGPFHGYILAIIPILFAAVIGNEIGKHYGMSQVDFRYGGVSDKAVLACNIVYLSVAQEFLWRGFFLGKLLAYEKIRYPIAASALIFGFWATPYYYISYCATTNELPWICVFIFYLFTNIACGYFWGWLRLKTKSFFVPALSVTILGLLLKPGLIPIYKVTGFFHSTYVFFDFEGCDRHGPLLPRILFLVFALMISLLSSSRFFNHSSNSVSLK